MAHGDSVELHWDQQSQTRTVMLDKATNIALMRLAPSFERYHAFCSEVEQSTREVAPVTDDDEAATPAAPNVASGQPTTATA